MDFLPRERTRRRLLSQLWRAAPPLLALHIERLVAAPPGKQSWKSIQRSNYFVVTLVAAHALGYLVLEKQKLPFDTAFATCIAIAFTAQAWGYSRRRSLRADANASSSQTPRSSE